MRHRLLSKQWVAAHLFVTACVVVFPILGWWQWERSQSATGGLQNFGYALQWPAFAIILICVWIKSMRDEIRPGKEQSHRRTLSKAETRPVQGVSLATKPEPAPGEPGGIHDEEDEEVAAYNRYLARLSARHEQRTAWRAQPNAHQDQPAAQHDQPTAQHDQPTAQHDQPTAQHEQASR